MTDRTVSVILQARITDYMTKMSAAGKATSDFEQKVALAKGRAAQGYHAIGVAGVAMGAAVAGGFAVAVKEAANFDARMALVRTLAHASANEMGLLRDAALHVGQRFGYTATQVADAEAELVKAGVSVKDMMGGALVGALTLASAGQTDVATATTIAATAMTQFKLRGQDVPHIADLLAAGADKALGSVVDLGYALDQAGPTAHQFGVSIEETVGTLAAFAQSGQIGERGGTIFQQMLLRLTAPGKQASAILKQLGISIYDANGQFVGMSNLAGQLQTKLGGLSLEQRNHALAVIFGARAIRAANILYQEGAKGIEAWTARVDDSGFAALQASGKLDSLSGDVTKLKAALQTAFITGGESGQGPLRTAVQDITAVVNAWDRLPAPVRAGVEALTLAAGAVALAGGAALLFIPKWTAMNAVLADTSVGAITAGRAIGVLGKTGIAVAGIAAVYEALNQLHHALAYTPPSADAFTNSLIELSRSGKVTGDLSKVIGNLKEVAGTFGSVPSGPLRDDLESIDKSLAALVTGGHLDVAQGAFGSLSSVMHRAGLTTDQITKLFPALSGALADSATSAKLSADGVDQFGNATQSAAKKTRSAADAAKQYSDQLHALADPLFAMNQALQGVTDAQHAATVAVHKYGADSPQAKQANLDLASSALDAEAAARTLAASVKNGSVSIGDARRFLKSWVADGLLTKQQADDVSGSFDHLIGRAETISGLHPHLKVTADTSQAETALSNLLMTIGRTISGFLTLGGVSGAATGTQPVAHGSGPGSNPVPPPSPGGSTSGGGHLTYTPTNSDSGYYTPGGSDAGGISKKDRPPTVQEIVHAILTGTIPPSIDKLSKVLQHEIGHLSTVVGNAQQYRSTVRSGLLGYASLSNNTGTTDSFGSAMTVGVNSYLKGRYAQLKQFVHLRERLLHDGASETLIEEFDALGPEANPEFRQLLSQGRRAVARASRLETRIHHLAGAAAVQASNDRYATALVRSVDRLPSRLQHAVVQGLRHAHFEVSVRETNRKQGKRIRQRG